MTCADIEVLLADYFDETLAATEKAAVEAHLGHCAGCTEFAQDIRLAMGLIERAAVVVPPAELLTRIAHQIPQGRPESVLTGGWRRFFGKYLQPVLQPRFAMGMAMTILSFSILGKFAGFEPRQLKPSDLNPAKVWQALDDKAQRSWDRAVKYYENIRLVYEIRSRMREWSELEETDRQSAAPAGVQPAQPGAEPAASQSGVVGNSGSVKKPAAGRATTIGETHSDGNRTKRK
jgi:hypothetical protein